MLQAIIGREITEHKYKHARYVWRAMLALSEYFLLCTVLAVRQSPVFALILDLSTDVAGHEDMLVYVKYWDWHKYVMVTSYLCCVRLVCKDGESLCDAIVKICTALGLNHVERLGAVSADGDSANQGWRIGLRRRIRDICNCVFFQHCAAHRHVLVINDVGNTNALLQLLDSVLNAVPNLFSRASKKLAVWELFAKARGVTSIMFPRFNLTRWFSRASCIFVMVGNYVVLVCFLYGVTREGSVMYWSAAQTVYVMLCRPVVVIVLHAMADIVTHLERARKLFETQGAELSLMRSEVSMLKKQMQAMAAKKSLLEFGGKHMDALRAASNNFAVNEEGQIVLDFGGGKPKVPLTKEPVPADLGEQLSEICSAVVRGLDDRFPEAELDVIDLFSIFDVTSIRAVPFSDLDTYGESELRDILQHCSKRFDGTNMKGFWCRKPLVDVSAEGDLEKV